MNPGTSYAKRPARAQVFVDTSGWIALAVEDDVHHEEVAALYPQLLKRHLLVTTNLVVAETHITLRRRLGHRAAISFAELVEASPRIRRVFSTVEVENEALSILKAYADQTFSYTDAVSFVVMRRLKIAQALSFDAHFRTMGFELLP